MRYAKRTDENHKELIAELREVLPDATITDLSGVGKGVPDILIGWKKMNFLFEIKDGEKTKSQRSLTDAQKDFHLKHQGQANVVTSAAEVCAILARIFYDKNN